MSDKDVNKVNELAEHEDQKTFQYMLQGKDNGRIKLGSAADNAELVGETPEKKRKKEFEELLISTAGKHALETADNAIQGMSSSLLAMSQNLESFRQKNERASYLGEQLTRITALLQNGTDDEKLTYLLEQGYSLEDIANIKKEGNVDDHLVALGKEMGGELLSLKELIERDSQSFLEAEAEYQRKLKEAEEALEKAEAEGATDEVKARRDEILNLNKEFDTLKQEYGETVLEWEKTYSNFDTIWSDFIEKDSSNRSYEDLAKNHLNEDQERNARVITSIREPFTQAATGESFTNDKSLESNISSIDSMPKLNTIGVDF